MPVGADQSVLAGDKVSNSANMVYACRTGRRLSGRVHKTVPQVSFAVKTGALGTEESGLTLHLWVFWVSMPEGGGSDFNNEAAFLAVGGRVRC